MGYYPIFIDLARQRCLVVGGGSIAERKVEGLLAVEANVTVVSPTLTDQLFELVQIGRVSHVGRPYQHGDLVGYRLAFAATGDVSVNTVIVQEGQQQGVLVNAVDDLSNCDFILPAVLRRGELVVAVATGGSAPSVSRTIRDELESYFTADYAMLVHVATAVRRALRQRGLSYDGEMWGAALRDASFRRLTREGRREEAERHLCKQLEAVPCQ